MPMTWSDSTPLGRHGYKAMAIVSMIVALLLADAGGWFLSRPPNTDCLPAALLRENTSEVPAIRTVVRPWRGPHHVYGLFAVPDQLTETKRYAVTITVKGTLRYCMWVERSRWHAWQYVATEDGKYLVRVDVPTRVALWFLMHGRLDDLRSTENWAMVFSAERS